MGDEEHKKAKSDPEKHALFEEGKAAPQKDLDQENGLIPPSEKVADLWTDRSSRGSVDRDAAFSRVETDKRLALIKAWEDNEKAKSDNKACKKLSSIGVWENGKKSSVEAKLKQIEEKLEKKKAEYAEQIKNRIAEIHREAEEKKAMVEAKKSEEFIKIDASAEKFRATGTIPKKFFSCFSS
ncbi:remorin-like [Tripterygium wilfordii]|uniref:Remorin-like n=1 Tax=Tripterygium wilfordii TaxID=458696 RepID=A0A7J7CK92_TRIWF|nr:remorin 1.4-like [Tripterygium wilfordii]KAF5734485.1 remorin-like [Tripterygium wilfordii]